MRTRRDEYLDLYEEIENKMIKLAKDNDMSGIIDLIERNIERLNIALYETYQNGETVSESRKPKMLVEKGIRLIESNYIGKLKNLKGKIPVYS